MKKYLLLGFIAFNQLTHAQIFEEFKTTFKNTEECTSSKKVNSDYFFIDITREELFIGTYTSDFNQASKAPGYDIQRKIDDRFRFNFETQQLTIDHPVNAFDKAIHNATLTLDFGTDEIEFDNTVSAMQAYLKKINNIYYKDTDRLNNDNTYKKERNLVLCAETILNLLN